MPICPGCEQKVPYHQLDLHERYCRGISGDAGENSVDIERLERRLCELERQFEICIEEVGVDVDRRTPGPDRARRDADRPVPPE